ncbi:hypothetical protein BBP40_000758 [Aspergillus hancockii]|nr:hypothetical protein BBP40_000758 [Aspergillus hancockii]
MLSSSLPALGAVHFASALTLEKRNEPYVLELRGKGDGTFSNAIYFGSPSQAVGTMFSAIDGISIISPGWYNASYSRSSRLVKKATIPYSNVLELDGVIVTDTVAVGGVKFDAMKFFVPRISQRFLSGMYTVFDMERDEVSLAYGNIGYLPNEILETTPRKKAVPDSTAEKPHESVSLHPKPLQTSGTAWATDTTCRVALVLRSYLRTP